MPRKILITCAIIVMVIILVAIFWDNMLFNTYYYLNYKIILPKYKESETIYSSVGRDQFIFERWQYTSKQFEKLKAKDYLKKIDEEEVLNLFDNLILEKNWFPNDIVEKNFDKEKIINKNNYYIFVPIEKDEKLNDLYSYEVFLFIILDTDSLSAYVFNIIT